MSSVFLIRKRLLETIHQEAQGILDFMSSISVCKKTSSDMVDVFGHFYSSAIGHTFLTANTGFDDCSTGGK